MSGAPEDTGAESHWDSLHTQRRFRPRYPSEALVRFLIGQFPEPTSTGRTALDIGVGGGRHTKLLCELGFTTSGVDISSEGLTQCRRWLGELGFDADLRHASMTDLPFSEASFDVAVSYGVFYYLDGDGMAKAVAEMRRVMRPGGVGFVLLRTTTDYRFGKGPSVGHNSFRLDIADTDEQGAVMHFVDERELASLFAGFSELHYEKADITFSDRKALNSDWIVHVRK